MRIFLILFILIPAAEIGVLMFSGKTIGVIPTVLLIILTGIIGSYLAKTQGLATWRKVQEQLQYGKVPGNEIMDGACILIGGIMLLSPGFLTDIVGLLFLLPTTRILMKPFILKFFQKWIDRNTITIIK